MRALRLRIPWQVIEVRACTHNHLIIIHNPYMYEERNLFVLDLLYRRLSPTKIWMYCAQTTVCLLRVVTQAQEDQTMDLTVINQAQKGEVMDLIVINPDQEGVMMNLIVADQDQKE